MWKAHTVARAEELFMSASGHMRAGCAGINQSLRFTELKGHHKSAC